MVSQPAPEHRVATPPPGNKAVSQPPQNFTVFEDGRGTKWISEWRVAGKNRLFNLAHVVAIVPAEDAGPGVPLRYRCREEEGTVITFSNGDSLLLECSLGHAMNMLASSYLPERDRMPKSIDR